MAWIFNVYIYLVFMFMYCPQIKSLSPGQNLYTTIHFCHYLDWLLEIVTLSEITRCLYCSPP